MGYSIEKPLLLFMGAAVAVIFYSLLLPNAFSEQD